MVIYVVIYLFLTFLSLLSANASKKSQMMMGWIALSIVALFQGLRWRTGTDWQPYLDVFHYANSSSPITNMEPGYLLLNKVIGLFTKDYTVFLFVTCFIRLWLIMRMARYFNVTNIAAIILFSFAGSVFPVRMHLAVAVFLNAYQYLVERNFIKYVIVVLIAASMHAAALVALPFYLLSFRSFSYRSLLIVYIGSCIVGFAATPILELITNILMQDFLFDSDFAAEKIRGNLEGDLENNRSLLSIILSLGNGLVFISIFGYIRHKYFNGDRKYDILFSLYVFGLAFNRLVINSVPYLSRVVELFAGGFCIMLLWWIAKQNASRRVVVLLILAIYAIFAYINYLNKFEDVVLPYYSVFSSSIRVVVY